VTFIVVHAMYSQRHLHSYSDNSLTIDSPYISNNKQNKNVTFKIRKNKTNAWVIYRETPVHSKIVSYSNILHVFWFQAVVCWHHFGLQMATQNQEDWWCFLIKCYGRQHGS